MPSTSEKQKRFFGAVMGAKEGEKGISDKAKKVSKQMSKEKIKDYLHTEKKAVKLSKPAKAVDGKKPSNKTLKNKKSHKLGKGKPATKKKKGMYEDKLPSAELHGKKGKLIQDKKLKESFDSLYENFMNSTENLIKESIKTPPIKRDGNILTLTVTGIIPNVWSDSNTFSAIIDGRNITSEKEAIQDIIDGAKSWALQIKDEGGSVFDDVGNYY